MSQQCIILERDHLEGSGNKRDTLSRKECICFNQALHEL